VGVGHLGITSKVTQPKLDFEVVKDVSTGKLKAQFMEFEITAFSNTMLGQVIQNNLKPQTRIPLVLKGNIKQDSQDIPVVITVTGEVHSVDDGVLEEGKEAVRKLKIKVDRYSKIVDGTPEVNFDRLNEILVVNGVDLLANYRTNVM
jgi:P2 family phage contractile tail tube protein